MGHQPNSQLNQIQYVNIVSYARICNMIGETSKNKQDINEALRYYLRGINYEPSYIENFLDLA
jgi:hypothetical protein